MSAQTAGKGSGRKSAAARAERNGKPKTAKFRGLTLKLPPELGVEVGYAYAELEGADGQVKPFIDFIRSLVGAEQFAKVQAKQAKDGVLFKDLAEDLNDLTERVFEAYGTDTGGSSASSAS